MIPPDFPRPFERTILLSLVSSHYTSQRGRGGRSSQKFRVRQCSRILSPSNSKLKAEELLCHSPKPTYFGCACGGRPAIGAMCHMCGGCEKSCQENAASLEEEEAAGKVTNAGSPKNPAVLGGCHPRLTPPARLRSAPLAEGSASRSCPSAPAEPFPAATGQRKSPTARPDPARGRRSTLPAPGAPRAAPGPLAGRSRTTTIASPLLRGRLSPRPPRRPAHGRPRANTPPRA